MGNRFRLRSCENHTLRLDPLDPSHVVGVTQVLPRGFPREKNPQVQGCTTYKRPRLRILSWGLCFYEAAQTFSAIRFNLLIPLFILHTSHLPPFFFFLFDHLSPQHPLKPFEAVKKFPLKLYFTLDHVTRELLSTSILWNVLYYFFILLLFKR